MSACLWLGWVALVAVVPSAPPPGHQSCRVDLIELNHFVDDEGREVFRQLIFYDWSQSQHRYLVRGWRLVKSADQLPRQTHKPAGHYCTWTENDTVNTVTAELTRETWTQHDPEKENRRWLSEDRRVPLWPSPTSPSRIAGNDQTIPQDADPGALR